VNGTRSARLEARWLIRGNDGRDRGCVAKSDQCASGSAYAVGRLPTVVNPSNIGNSSQEGPHAVLSRNLKPCPIICPFRFVVDSSAPGLMPIRVAQAQMPRRPAQEQVAATGRRGSTGDTGKIMRAFQEKEP